MTYQEINQNLFIKNLSNETFKDIPGYEGTYQISNLGRVKSLKRKLWNGKAYFYCEERILKQGKNKKGYLRVNLSKNNKNNIIEIHRLVLLTFISKCPEGKEVNHKDGNKQNNKLENLEYVTHKYNMIHAKENNLLKYDLNVLIKNNKNKKIKIKQYDLNNNFIGEFESINEAIRQTGITSIPKVFLKNYKTAGGYLWEKE